MSADTVRNKPPELRLFSDSGQLAAAAATAVAEALQLALEDRDQASLVLTGGRVGGAVLDALLHHPRAPRIDWSRIHWWWGDERFLPANDPDRNETQARAALLDHLPVTPAFLHPMPASDGPVGGDLSLAQAQYEAVAAKHLDSLEDGDGRGFDLVLLSIGEDGHVASLFPGHPALASPGLVAAITDSPKPPSLRLTHTLSALNSAGQILVLAAGAEKAEAVRRVLVEGNENVPARLVHGRERTIWFVDRPAASGLLAEEAGREAANR